MTVAKAAAAPKKAASKKAGGGAKKPTPYNSFMKEGSVNLDVIGSYEASSAFTHYIVVFQSSQD
jgi:hypothetical protein